MAISSLIRPDKSTHGQVRTLALGAAGLVVCFASNMLQLLTFSLKSDLYSYIVIVPVISLGLVWLNRNSLPPPSVPNRLLAKCLFGAGLIAVASRWLPSLWGQGWSGFDELVLASLAFVLLLAGLCSWFLGRRTVAALAFPLGILVLMVPFPVWLSNLAESFLQHASAMVAYQFFQFCGTPVYQLGTVAFQLPGITLNVAPQCSGLHSSVALFVTSLPAGFLFLRSPWKRAAFSLVAIPLGILRNGFRIFTIGELCVHIGPQMIDSYIHHTGGWIFFLLSLVPFFLILLLLAKLEQWFAVGGAKRIEA